MIERTSIAIDKALRRRVEVEARRRGVSVSRLFCQAVEAMLREPNWVPFESLDIRGGPRDGAARYRETVGEDPHA